MDWATFIKDNSQSLFTLGGVFLGSVITFLINYLNLSYQSKEKDKDRREQRKEAKTQLALEIKMNEIKTIEGVIDDTLIMLRVISRISAKREVGQISDDDVKQEVVTLITDENSIGVKNLERAMIASKLVATLDKEFSQEWDRFHDQLTTVVGLVMNQPALFRGELYECEENMIESAGKLHNMLREQLLLIRDN